MDFSKETLVRMTDALISYHMNSFRIRRKNLLSVDLVPSVVIELDNMRARIGDELLVEDSVDQAEGFNGIIQSGREEISRQREMAESSDDATPYLERAQELMEEMSAAQYLMELMDDD